MKFGSVDISKIYFGENAINKTMLNNINILNTKALVADGLFFHMSGAKATGTSPGTNSPQVTVWQELIGNRDASLVGFAYNSTSGWQGTGTPEDPYALKVNGSMMYGDYTLPKITGVLTLETWVYLTRPSDFQGIISLVDYGYPYLCFTGGKFMFYGHTSAYRYSALVLTQSDMNKWYHVVCEVVDPANVSTWNIYVNGVLSNGSISSGTSNYAGTGTRGWIGCSPNNYYLYGAISMISMYNRALTAVEVLNNYNCGANACAV